MIAIIDYKAGNLTSVERAVRHLGYEVMVSSDAAVISAADRIIFPGVGAAGQAMRDLRALGLDLLIREACAAGKPLLGICLGTQIIFDYSQENDTACLGLVPGIVKKFPEALHEEGRRLKIPHMGWNRVDFKTGHPVFAGLDPESEFYFVHAYYPEIAPSAKERYLACTTRYGVTFTSAIAAGNLVAVQFHPEKSGKCGLRILDNFCRWRPSC